MTTPKEIALKSLARYVEQHDKLVEEMRNDPTIQKLPDPGLSLIKQEVNQFLTDKLTQLLKDKFK